MRYRVLLLPMKGENMNTAVIIKTNGSKMTGVFNADNSYTVISDAVGGLIELVSLTKHDADMWINENGKYECEFQNPIATALWAEMYGTTDVIMGDVIITGGSDAEGETLGLTNEQIKFFMEYDNNLVQLALPSNYKEWA